MSNEILIFSVVLLFFLFAPMCWSIGEYFQQKAYTEMRNRGDRTFFERLREKRKSK